MMQVAAHRFTVDDYYRMAEAGILQPDQRVELLDGQVVEMTPIGRRHAACVDRLTDLFTDMRRGRAVVRVQNPIRLDQHSEPEPDVTLLKPRDDYYAEREPHAYDVLLLIEVCDTTLAKDRDIKLPLYAKAGVVEVWLADLESRAIHVHREPGDGRYAKHTTITDGQSVTPVSFGDVELTPSHLFGK